MEIIYNEKYEVARAYKLAIGYHEGRVDKQGTDYYVHLLRVMDAVCKERELVVAALLYDILEDTNCTREILLSCGISEDNVKRIERLTRRQNEKCSTYS